MAERMVGVVNWELVPMADGNEPPFDLPQTPPKGTVWCECGRFARWVGERHYYNGHYDCYSYTVDCSRCGEVTIECV